MICENLKPSTVKDSRQHLGAVWLHTVTTNTMFGSVHLSSTAITEPAQGGPTAILGTIPKLIVDPNATVNRKNNNNNYIS